MKFNIEKLKDHELNGLLEVQRHPSLPLTIYNYSQEVQYGDLWDDVLIHCRGLVLDDNGEIVAKPFKKFFNMEEKKHTASKNFSVWEKVDGSLGILFFYEGEWHLSSRGSFTSEQAVKGKEILDLIDHSWKENFNKNYTYLFEIIYPENRIVVDYEGEEHLVFLGAVDNDTWKEMTPSEALPYNVWFQNSLQYLIEREDTLEKLKALNMEGKEGFVVVFENGEKCKIKFDWYLSRHKVVWSLTNRLIWEHLLNGTIDELIEMVPDEYYDVVKEEISLFIFEFEQIKFAYEKIFNFINDKHRSRKEFAERALKYQFSSILFAMLDKRDVEPIIWKIIYPTISQKILTK